MLHARVKHAVTFSSGHWARLWLQKELMLSAPSCHRGLAAKSRATVPANRINPWAPLVSTKLSSLKTQYPRGFRRIKGLVLNTLVGFPGGLRLMTVTHICGCDVSIYAKLHKWCIYNDGITASITPMKIVVKRVIPEEIIVVCKTPNIKMISKMCC